MGVEPCDLDDDRLRLQSKSHVGGPDTVDDSGVNDQWLDHKAPTDGGGQHVHVGSGDCIGCDGTSKVKPDDDTRCPNDAFVALLLP